MRTQEQIVADCEKRFEEIQAEVQRREEDRRHTHSCTTCRFAKWDGSSLEYWTCSEPLVVGLEDPYKTVNWSSPFHHGKWQGPGKTGEVYWDFPPLCGPEKALWQPVPQRPPPLWPILIILCGLAGLIALVAAL